MSAIQATALPATIDEVIRELEAIIAQCSRVNDCAGYFPVLYHRTTCHVRDRIAAYHFDDGARMERLDVIFANRYITAWRQYQSGQPCTASWLTAFEATRHKPMMVLQHLLLGMHAHINLDLGIAAAACMHGYALQDIRRDFDAINNILSDMVAEVQERLLRINPLMRLLPLNSTDADELLVNFSIQTARQGAWAFASRLTGLQGADYESCIATRDRRIAELGRHIARPRGWMLQTAVRTIAAFERGRPALIMAELGRL